MLHCDNLSMVSQESNHLHADTDLSYARKGFCISGEHSEPDQGDVMIMKAPSERHCQTISDEHWHDKAIILVSLQGCGVYATVSNRSFR